MNLNRQGLRQMILGLAGRLIKWSTINRLSSRKGWVYAEPPPVEPELGEEAQPQLVRLIQHFGLRSQPTTGSEIIVGAPRCFGTNAVALGTDNLGCGPSDLEEGATALYSSADRKNSGVQELCRVHLGADGKVTVDSKTGQDVVVNGGTAKVAREGDPVAPTATFAAVMQILVNIANQVITPAPGTITPAQAAGIADLIGTINGGSARFKA